MNVENVDKSLPPRGERVERTGDFFGGLRVFGFAASWSLRSEYAALPRAGRFAPRARLRRE
ncbi:MAG: hypothetical protein ACI4JY_12350 [Oscillospiraceae bacterium]